MRGKMRWGDNSEWYRWCGYLDCNAETVCFIKRNDWMMAFCREHAVIEAIRHEEYTFHKLEELPEFKKDEKTNQMR